MKVIKSLTKAQETEMPAYIEKWINAASGETDIPSAISFTKKIYKNMKEEEPVIMHFSSPMLACLAAAFFKEFSQLDSQLSSQLRSQLSSQLDSQLRSQLSSQLDSQLSSQLDSQLRSQLDSQLFSQLSSLNTDWYLSLWWILWCGYYDFAQYIGVEFNKKIYSDFMGYCSNVIFSVPYKGICFISHKPLSVRWKNRILHNDGGPAVEFSDGYGLWALNGVRVPQIIAETKAEALDPQLALDEKNADVQREIIRKIGPERMLKACNAKTLDDWKDPQTGYKYKLMDMSIGENIRRKYLYFEHASIPGVFYAKPLPPEVKKAMHGRAWILGMVERNELPDINTAKEQELINQLPKFVS